MNTKFLNTPDELQQLPKWVCWNYKETTDGKKTKIPINPLTRKYAKKNDPSTWCSFEDAVAHSVAYDGIGFMVTHDDPYIFVDFDHSVDQAVISNQQFYYQQLNSYSELSPSGKGLHILVRGKLESGRRRNNIEVYPYSFMTFTGEVVNNVPIREAQILVEQLWESLEGIADNKAMATYNFESTTDDFSVFEMARNAKNGNLFIDLWEGRWQQHDHTGQKQSAADIKLINILAFYTQDRGQITRMFRESALGQRDKAKRHDYISNTITKAFDNIIPEIDFSGLMANLIVKPPTPLEQSKSLVIEAVSVKHVTPEPKQIESNVKEYDLPPGLTGDITRFIYDQAWKPVEQISILGALGFMAGIAGRQYNASGYGLNLYLLLLAKTGRGKEGISKGYEKLFNAIAPMMPQIRSFKGPGDLASGQALLRYMSDHQTKCFVSVFGEFGPMLKRITSPTAIGADLMTQKVMLDFYSKSGRSGMVDPTAYSDAEKNTKSIQSPAFTFIAESAPKWFDNLADEGMIETGLLPRFIISEYNGIRVPSNESGPGTYPAKKLTEDIMAMTTQVGKHFQAGLPYTIPFDSVSAKMSRELDVKCDHIINTSTEDIICELWNRVHINTIKVAGIIAVGINPIYPVIDKVAWDWAESFVIHNVETLTAKFEGGVLKNYNDSESDEVKKVEESVIEFLIKPQPELVTYGVPVNLHQCRVIPWAYFSRRLSRIKPFKDSKIGSTNSIKRAVANMIDNGDLQEIAKTQAIRDFDFHGRCFAIRSTRLAQQASGFR